MAVTAIQGIVQGKLQAGGTLGEGYRYIQRPADDELRESLLAGELCYVLAPRQIGKSSLRVRTEAALTEREVRVATLSLDTIGTAGTAAEWFGSLIKLLNEQLLPGHRLKNFWEESHGLTPAHRFAHYLREHVLVGTANAPIVVFIDEIDTLLSGGMPRDDFFAVVRSLYNDRATDPACGRLTFCLLGVAAPGDLIGDPVRTNFNIGRRVVLRDFTQEEARGFQEDLADLGGDPGALLARIYEWTHGHPFMTQRLCVGLHEQRKHEAPIDVDSVVRELFLRSGRSDDPNLSYAEERLARHSDPGPLLSLYRRLLEAEGEPVVADRGDWMQLELQLCGFAAARKEGERLYLRVRNRVFATVFGPEWVKEKMGGRLLAIALARWQEAGRRAEAVLRNSELTAAQAWAKAHPREVTAEESEFLLACIEEARRETEEQRLAAEVGLERERREHVEAAAHAQRRLIVVLTAAVVGLLGLAGSLTVQYEKANRYAQAERKAASEARRYAQAAQEAASEARRSAQAEQKAASEAYRSAQAEQKAASEARAQREQVARERDRAKQLAKAEAKARKEAEAATKLAEERGESAGRAAIVATSAEQRAVASAARERAAREQAESLIHTGQSLRAAALATEPEHLMEALVAGMKAAQSGIERRHFEAQNWEGLLAATRRCVPSRPLEGHSGGVLSAAFSPDGKTVVTGSRDQTARLWEVSSGKLLRTLAGHSNEVGSAAFSPDGKTVVTGGDDQTVRLWEVSSGTLLSTLAGHSARVNSAVFSPDGKTVVTGSNDGMVLLWGASSGKILFTLEGNSAQVNSAAFSPNGKIVITGGNDGMARLWEVSSGTLLHTLEGHSDWVNSVAFSPDGKTVATGSWDKTARLWEVSSGKFLRTLEGHSGVVHSAAFSSDGKTMVTGSGDGTARLWETSSGKFLRALGGHSDVVHSAMFSPDGKTMVTGSEDGTARLWEVTNGKFLRALERHSARVNSATFSPDGKTMLTESWDGTVRLWEARSGKLLRTLERYSAGVRSAAVSPDGTTLVTGSGDGAARLWEARSGKLLRTLKMYSGGVLSAAVSPDDKIVFTGSSDGTVRLWEAASGKLLRSLERHSGGVLSVAVSPDGKTVITGSRDGTARLWEVASGKLLFVLEGHSSTTASVVMRTSGGAAFLVWLRRLRLVTTGATGQPRGDDAGHGETEGNEGISKVPLRPRARANRLDAPIWARGKNAALAQPR